jgi:CDP-glycerol glycerophosphotransferase (TagB/SpsB family)
LIPPSDKLTSIAKKYGWKDDNIIKINLPRWDKYNLNNDSCHSKNYNSIFFLFTWREIKKGKTISPSYFQNINLLFHNLYLKEALEKNNIILYFSLHHKIHSYNKYRLLFKKYNHLTFVDEKKISKCLLKTSLVITDFSSIIFDIIYRGKPFIIYIPDANDPNISDIYSKNYYELISSIKNGTIEFENKYFNINETINKIIYYINNNFTLDDNLKNFYDDLEIKKVENNTNKFINYLTSIN